MACNAIAQTADERLFAAIDESKPLVAEGLILSREASAQARAANGETPLHRAVEKGMRELAELLVHAGANLRARSATGETALHLAALHADPWFVELLVTARADPRVRNDDGESPLHWAALSGNAATAERLLYRGADPDMADIRGNLPLHGAADGGDLATVRLLLGRTQDRAARNREGLNAADIARARGYAEIAALLGGAPVRQTRAAPAGEPGVERKPAAGGIRSMDIDDPEHPRFKNY